MKLTQKKVCRWYMPIYTANNRRAFPQNTHTYAPQQTNRNVELPEQGPKLKPQSQLTDAEFGEALKGYTKIEDNLELFNVPLGSRIRYIIDVLDDAGNFVERKYRYGGVLTVVDQSLRYFMLKNMVIANSNKQNQGRGGKASWSVQLKDPKQRVIVYYSVPPKQGELAMFRQMMADLEAGKIQINKT